MKTAPPDSYTRHPGRDSADALSVCLAICTRDRAESLRDTIASLVARAGSAGRLVIIDQSSGDATLDVVAAADPGLLSIHHVRHDERGLSRARNAALALAPSDGVLVFTDDDCLARDGWLEAMVAPFRDDPNAGIAFGTVAPTPVDASVGFIVGYEPRQRRALRGRLGKLKDGGIGASMAVRVSAARAIGGFDEMLGAGGHFPSCEDGDFAYRMLKGGYTLYHVPEAVVDHYGLREWHGSSRLITSTYYAVGAAYAKYLRCGDAVGALLLGQQMAFACGEISKNLVRLRRPLGLRRVTHLVRGATRGFFSPVDRRTVRFVVKP